MSYCQHNNSIETYDFSLADHEDFILRLKDIFTTKHGSGPVVDHQTAGNDLLYTPSPNRRCKNYQKHLRSSAKANFTSQTNASTSTATGEKKS